MKKYDGRMLWGALLAVAALSVAAWREGASGAGYALMMLAMFLIFALSSGARKQREPAGVAAALSPGEVPSVRLDDVAANEEAMESLRDILSFIRSPEKYAAFGARVPRGEGKTEREREKRGGKPPARRRRDAGKKGTFEPDSAFRSEKKKPAAAEPSVKTEKKGKKVSEKTRKIAAATKAKRGPKKKPNEA